MIMGAISNLLVTDEENGDKEFPNEKRYFKGWKKDINGVIERLINREKERKDD